MSFLLVSGDTDSSLTVACQTPDGSVIDLTGATVRLYYRIAGGSPQVRGMSVVGAATAGVVSYKFQAGDLTVGELSGEVEIQFADTSILTSALAFKIQVRMRTYGPARPTSLSRLIVLDPNTFQAINNSGGTISFGTPIYLNSPGTMSPAIALPGVNNPWNVEGMAVDSSVSNTLGTVIGEGIMSGTQEQWATITGDINGLEAGIRYYLSPAEAGQMVAEGYNFLVGQVALPLGTALTSLIFRLEIGDPTFL